MLARQTVMDRDERRCQKCGGPAHDVHHIVTRGAAPWLKYDLENLIALDRDHHSEAHLYPATFMVFLGEKWPGRWNRMWEKNRLAERRGASVDLGATIRDLRDPALSPADVARYESGSWLG